MAIALVGSITHRSRVTDTGANQTIVRAGVTAGSLLILPMAWFNGEGLTGMSVSDGVNTWQAVSTTPASGDTSSHVGIFYAMNVAAGDTTITFNPQSGGSPDCTMEGDVLEFSGMLTAAAVDVTPADASGTGDPTITTGTLSQADEVVIMINSHTGADLTTMVEDSADGFTEISQNLDNDLGQSYQSQYKITSATTSLAILCDYNASRAWFATAASFKGAGGVTSILRQMMQHH